MRRAVVAVVAALFIALFVVDLANTRAYGGVDLRERVVGGRLLFSGQSPYTYHWKAGDPEEWLDPSANPDAALNRYTGSPAQSLLFATIGWLPYAFIRVAWTLLQYALFVGALLLLARAAPPTERALLWAGAVALVLGSAHWRLHVERGQMYVLFAFLIAAALSLATRPQGRWRLYGVGVLIAVLAAFKPPFILLGLPFVFALRRQVVAGMLVGALAVVMVSVATGTLSQWPEYARAMQRWSVSSFDIGAPATDRVPPVIEGMTTLRLQAPFEFEDVSARGVAAMVAAKPLSARACTLLALAALGVLSLAFAGRWRAASDTDLLLGGFAVATIVMACLPAARFNYQQVLWLGPLVVMLRDRAASAKMGVVMMVVGALAGLRLLAFVPHSYTWGEAGMVAGLLVILWRRPSLLAPKGDGR